MSACRGRVKVAFRPRNGIEHLTSLRFKTCLSACNQTYGTSLLDKVRIGISHAVPIMTPLMGRLASTCLCVQKAFSTRSAKLKFDTARLSLALKIALRQSLTSVCECGGCAAGTPAAPTHFWWDGSAGVGSVIGVLGLVLFRAGEWLDFGSIKSTSED